MNFFLCFETIKACDCAFNSVDKYIFKKNLCLKRSLEQMWQISKLHFFLQVMNKWVYSLGSQRETITSLVTVLNISHRADNITLK